MERKVMGASTARRVRDVPEFVKAKAREIANLLPDATTLRGPPFYTCLCRPTFCAAQLPSIGDAAKLQVSSPRLPTCTPEHLPVRLEGISWLFSPFLKQSRIVLQL